ncbi:hypothetical protein [Flavobacterium sp. HNIBRBA15423]|uniref:hypothetical protein n=1 Tax=Flavobacterium sp. HNIBRBA15423 TaxID=3458683 RepID=UPI0040444DF8
MLSEIEQQTLDIDWFFLTEKNIGFIASGGGKIPLSVSKMFSKNHDVLVSYFRNLPETSDFIINEQLIKMIDLNVNNQYVNDFAYMAKRGLYSFDKTILNNYSDTNYHLVAKPTNPLLINNLPLKIKQLLIKTFLDIDIKKIDKIDISIIK